MNVLARMQDDPGRRVLMPRPGDRFLGPRDRARARARERRRRVLTVLLEGIGLTALVGAFPPLRGMWIVSGILLAALTAYVWMLVQVRAQAGVPARAAAPPPQPLVLPSGEEPAELFDQEEPAAAEKRAVAAASR